MAGGSLPNDVLLMPRQGRRATGPRPGRTGHPHTDARHPWQHREGAATEDPHPTTRPATEEDRPDHSRASEDLRSDAAKPGTAHPRSGGATPPTQGQERQGARVSHHADARTARGRRRRRTTPRPGQSRRRENRETWQSTGRVHEVSHQADARKARGRRRKDPARPGRRERGRAARPGRAPQRSGGT